MEISLLIYSKFAAIKSDVNITSSFLVVRRSNLSFYGFILINKTKKDSSSCLLQELSRTYDGRIKIEVTRTPSIRDIGGPPRSLEIGFLDIFQSKKNWNFLTSISLLGLLNKPASQISAKSARYRGRDLFI